MATADPLVASAISLHRSGQLEAARGLYRQFLDSHPARADVWNLLGMASRQLGCHVEAIDCLHRAIALDGSQAVYFGNLAEAHRGLGQLAEAIAGYREAARLAPDVADIHGNLGVLLQQTGRLDEAEVCYARALHADPRNPDAHYNLGNVHQAKQLWESAIGAYRQALVIRPEFFEAQCNLGNALREADRLAESLDALQQARALRPDSAAVLGSLGAVLQDLGRLDDSRPCFERAVQVAPDNSAAHLNLGTLYKDLGDLRAAIACYDRALALQADHAQALTSRATAHLALGDFAAGWAGYEHRLGCQQYDTPSLPQPRWDGAPLAGRTLLIHCEQGLGDTLQFIRYVALARQRGGPVVVAVQPALLPLLASSAVPNLVPAGQPLPVFDVYAPLLSLPYLLQTRLDTVPADVPYLAAEPARIEHWKNKLHSSSSLQSPASGLKVGIVWQGRRKFRGDRLRSIPLAALAPLAEVPGVQLFSLQKGPGSEQLAAQTGARDFDVVDLGRSLDNEGAAFVDTAAVMQSLDLVVTSDTAAAHLAGALAVPVWVALAAAPDWRWLRDRDDSPWYPTMRLFRQTTPGDWSDLFARIAAELREFRSSRPGSAAD